MEGKPVVNRLGTARIVLTIDKPVPYPIVTCDEYGNNVSCNTIKGTHTLVIDDISDQDLFMAPETITVWVNVYKDKDRGTYNAGAAFLSKDEADYAKSMLGNYLGTISGTIEL